MAPDEDRSDTPLLDEWRSNVGDDAVAAAVAAARERIADGSTPGFSDERRFLNYLEDTPRRSA